MERPFQIGDIVVFWINKGTPKELRVPGLHVQGFDKSTGRVIARSYFDNGEIKDEVTAPASNFTLVAPPSPPKAPGEAHHATLEILHEMKEIKELLITLVSLLER
jgi:hypothetical protein